MKEKNHCEDDVSSDTGFLEMKLDSEYRCYTNEDVYGTLANEESISYALFHYTNLKVLDALLSTSTFWASHIMYLNDPKECTAAKGIDAKGTNKAGIFVVSFSQEKDSLHQWITYAKESGVAVELDYDLICSNKPNQGEWFCVDSFVENIEFKNQIAIKLKYPIHKIHYGEIPLDKEIGRPNEFQRLWPMAYEKEKSYKGENEVRLAVFATCKISENAKVKSKINYFYMPEKCILRPFLKLTLGYAPYTRDRKFTPCLPLKSITIGPSGIQQTIFDSVVHRLKYGECKVYDYFNKDFNKFILNFVNYLCEVLNYLENEFPNLTLKPDDISTYLNENKFDKENPQSFSEKLKNVIKYIIKNYNVNINEKLLNQSKDYLKDFLAEKIEYLIKDWVVNNIGLFNTESGEGALDKLNKTLNCDKISEIKRNFYFTKEGIIIRKSKIPYIF